MEKLTKEQFAPVLEKSKERLGPVMEKLAEWAPGPNLAVSTPGGQGRIAGFWLGYWHGMIAPITMLISLKKKDMYVYEVHNNGVPYNAGFVLGLMMTWGRKIGPSKH